MLRTQSCLIPVLLYGAEVWGYSAFPEIRQIQQRAIRVFFWVHCFAPIAGIEGDMGWLDTRYRQWIRMLSFWNRLVTLTNDRLTRIVFDWNHDQALAGVTNWCSQIRDICRVIEIEEVFFNKQVCEVKFCEEKLKDIQEKEWKETISRKPKLRF